MRRLSDFEHELLRLMWALSGSGRSGEPRGAERKRLMRKIREMGRNGTKPVDMAATTRAAHERSLRFIETLFANGERARRGELDYLKEVPPAKRYAYLAKPWKGAAGRSAAKLAKPKKTEDKRARALQMQAQGHSHAKIASALGCTDRTVRRYLNGR